jgi:hypothetical protein
MDSVGPEHCLPPGSEKVQQDDAVSEFTLTFVLDLGTQLGVLRQFALIVIM